MLKIFMILNIFIITCACGMSGKPIARDFQIERDLSETFYWACSKDDRRFCSKTCKKRLRNGSCEEWNKRKPLDVNNDDDWNLIRNGRFILIKKSLVF